MPEKILSLEELKKLRFPIKDIHREHRASLGPLQKLALWVTKNVGSMGFFLVIFIWTFSWLTWNTLGPREFRFDPYPAFVLWLFISNMIQLFLLPLILFGQNLENKYAERRAQSDFELNKKTEREIETVLLHLEKQAEILSEILGKIK